MRAIIVDDEQPAIDMLKVLLEPHCDIEIVGTYRKPSEAIAAARELAPDIAFLDIQMPLMSGLELAERLLAECERLEIVFATAYGDYALEAFQVNAVDYLLKPVSEEELARSLNKLSRWRRPAPSPPSVRKGRPRLQAFREFVIYGGEGAGAAAGPVAWRTFKAQELMAYLYLHRGSDISKWDIINDLWPEHTEKQALTNLHTSLYQIRKTLKQAGIEATIEYRNGRYHMRCDELYSDAEQLKEADRWGEELSSEGAEQVRAALELYKGELLATWDADWVDRLRQRYGALYERLLVRLCRYLLRQGSATDAEHWLKRLLLCQPLDEDATEMLMRVYLKCGNRIAFVQTYRALENQLLAELGIAPSGRLQHLFESAYRP